MNCRDCAWRQCAMVRIMMANFRNWGHWRFPVLQNRHFPLRPGNTAERYDDYTPIRQKTFVPKFTLTLKCRLVKVMPIWTLFVENCFLFRSVEHVFVCESHHFHVFFNCVIYGWMNYYWSFNAQWTITKRILIMCMRSCQNVSAQLLTRE